MLNKLITLAALFFVATLAQDDAKKKEVKWSPVKDCDGNDLATPTKARCAELKKTPCSRTEGKQCAQTVCKSETGYCNAMEILGDIAGAAGMAIGIIILLAVGIPCLCCCIIGLIVYFACKKGGDRPPIPHYGGLCRLLELAPLGLTPGLARA